MTSSDAIETLIGMRPEDVPVSALAISDTMDALPMLDRGVAMKRARVQLVATMSRVYLQAELPYFSYAVVRTFPSPHLRDRQCRPEE